MDGDRELRAAMLTAAERLLAASPDMNVATRAVCEAVQVTQPVLFRLFGDKRGLLDALADEGLSRYAAHKAQRPETTDPVADLRDGWDDHMGFADANPALYQLMFVPRPWSRSVAREQIFVLLMATLTRCAAAGALAIDAEVAARIILSANLGLALNRIALPALFGGPGTSTQLRDTIFAQVLVKAGPPAPARPVRAAARRLRSQLLVSGTDGLDPAEQQLLEVWLRRITDRP